MWLFRKKPAPAVVIGENASPEVAQAQLDAWQREKSLRLADKALALVAEANAEGLDRKRITGTFLAIGSMLAGPQGKNGVGS